MYRYNELNTKVFWTSNEYTNPIHRYTLHRHTDKGMPIVTLTTDFGLKDYYVAIIKGAILRESPNLQIIDITHHIPHHNIVQAAFVLKNAYASFPEGTLHIVSVNTHYSKESSFLLMQHEGYFFLLPDNGTLTLLFDPIPENITRIFPDNFAEQTLNMLYAKIAKHLAMGKPMEELGEASGTIEQRITLQAVISPAQIRGSVIHIDNYENVVVNITKDLFEKVGEGRKFRLYFKRHDPILKLSEHYQDVAIGEELCLFNAANYLEIAINMGSAASMLGLKVDDTVQIDFE